MLKPKYLFVTLTLGLSLNAIDVVVAKYDLQYQQQITYKNIILNDFKSIKKNCIPLVLKDLKKKLFVKKILSCIKKILYYLILVQSKLKKMEK